MPLNCGCHRAIKVDHSADPFFVEKVHDIIGLYLNPPDHAMVLCVDEKSHTTRILQIRPTTDGPNQHFYHELQRENRALRVDGYN